MFRHRVTVPLSVALAFVAASVACAPAAQPSPASADTLVPSSIQLLTEMNPQPVGRTATLWVNVEPSTATGSIVFYRISGDERIELGSAPIEDCPGVFNCRRTIFDLPSSLGEGSYPIVATYAGDGLHAPAESDVLVQLVGPRPTTTAVRVFSPREPTTTILKNDQLEINATVLDAGQYQPNEIPVMGHVSIRIDGVEVRSTEPDRYVSVATSGLAIGTHTITAVYSGTTDHAPSTSAPVLLTVKPDVAEASGVGASLTTFYPSRDGYRDSVAIRGTRKEPISVAIRITSPTGRVVRTASIARGTGGYSYAWNGRTSTGTMLAAGTYKVVQTLTDALGARAVVTSYVSLSHKRLYYYTTTIEKTAAQYTKRTASWIGWQFTMPAATVYKAITFSVYGRTGVSPARIGPWDLRRCAWSAAWDPGCVSRTTAMTATTTSWVSIGVSTANERSGRYVRGFAFLPTTGSATVYRSRLKVTYGLLK